ncbi:MAG: HEAT repeat domain-containing protein [Gemmatimonadetes bacterium]|nr:HEAT repeat domain-containing protein [Gemmatimonadota bacterium]
MVVSSAPEAPSGGVEAPETGPDALSYAVSRFLEADRGGREGLAEKVLAAAAALREETSLDELADAVGRLARAPGGTHEGTPWALARAVLTPGIAGRLAERLGSARDERGHADLVTVCVRLGRDMALALSDALSDTTDRFARRAYMDVMVQMGEDGIAVAEEMVEDGRWFVVRNAAAVLGEIGGERAVGLLASALAHEDARVRREALHALAKVGGEDAGQLVYGMIGDPDSDVRAAAAMAAGALRVPRALRPLLVLLEEERDPDVVVTVLHALGQLADPAATPAIEKRAARSFFSRPPTDVRIAAYRALYSIRTPRAKRVLVGAADDKDPRVRAAVRELLFQR